MKSKRANKFQESLKIKGLVHLSEFEFHGFRYKSMFADVYGEDSKIAEETLDEAIKAVEKKEKPSKIKTALSVLKDITLRVSSSLIATGILGLLKQLNL